MISGLGLNNNKTDVLGIRAYTGSQDKLYHKKYLKWITDKGKALDVWISSNPVVSMKANGEKLLLKVSNCLSCWEYHCLSLFGEIIVLRSLITLQLVYILSPLPTNHATLDEIDNIFYNFLWSKM